MKKLGPGKVDDEGIWEVEKMELMEEELMIDFVRLGHTLI